MSHSLPWLLGEASASHTFKFLSTAWGLNHQRKCIMQEDWWLEMGLMNPSWLSGPQRICLEKKVPPEMNQLLIYTLDTTRSQNTEWAVQAAVSVGKTSSLCARPSSNLEHHQLPCISPFTLIFHCPKPLPPLCTLMTLSGTAACGTPS